MKPTLCIIVLCLLTALPSLAQQPGFQDDLLDELVGDWVLKGTIDGDESVHDIHAEWILGHQYLRFHEVSREKDENGELLYEASVHIGWDEPSGRYACLWLDSTGGGGLSNGIIGFAKPGGDQLAFVFAMGEDSVFHTTFRFDRDAGTWQWRMDSERGGQRKPFSRVVLTRADDVDSGP